MQSKTKIIVIIAAVLILSIVITSISVVFVRKSHDNSSEIEGNNHHEQTDDDNDSSLPNGENNGNNESNKEEKPDGNGGENMPDKNSIYLKVKNILKQIHAVYDKPGVGNTNRIVDAPLLGNGDTHVVVDGSYEGQKFYVSKSDLSNPFKNIGSVEVLFKQKQNTNLASKATITASSDDVIPNTTYGAQSIVNGDMPENSLYSNHWMSFAGTNDAHYTVNVDFSSTVSIKKIQLYLDTAFRTEESKENNLSDFTVEYLDGKDWRVIKSFTNNTEPVIDIELNEKISTRYLKINITKVSVNPNMHPDPHWFRARIQQLVVLSDLPASDENSNEKLNYRQEQDLLNAKVISNLPVGSGTIAKMETFVADDRNLLITKLCFDRKYDKEILLKLNTMQTSEFRTGSYADDNVIWMSRTVKDGTTALSATTIIGADNAVTADGVITFNMPKSNEVYIVTLVGGGAFSDKISPDSAKEELKKIDSASIIKSAEYHADWWKDYWSSSYISLDSELIMKYYYGAQYIMGSASRKGGTEMGLAGPWRVNDDVIWSGSYTFNYNFEAPFWGMVSSNRLNTIHPYFTASNRMIAKSKEYAQKLGFKGVLFQTGAYFSWDELSFDLRQKGNANLALMTYISYYMSTYDDDFLVNTMWPLLKECEAFWYDNRNLKYNKEKDIYEVLGSASRESGGGKGQTGDGAIKGKNCPEIAYLYNMYKFLSDESVLNAIEKNNLKLSNGDSVSQNRIDEWKNRSEKMAPIPTYNLDGKKIFVEYDDAAPGLTGVDGNPISLFSVFPGNYLSLGSEPELLEIARNTIDYYDAWSQYNSFATLFTMAARVGYDPEILISKLEERLKGNSLEGDNKEILQNNLAFSPNWHAIEGTATIEAVNSLFLQSHDGIIRYFPVWDKNKSCEFESLRAYGAFLTSGKFDAETKQVVSASLFSEKGKTAKVACPFDKGMIVKDSEGNIVNSNFEIEKTTGNRIYSFETAVNQMYFFEPCNE